MGFFKKSQTVKIPKQFKRDKLIFIHIPKCAGSAFLNSYLGYQLGHIKVELYLKNYRSLFENFFVFSFVRNPINRFISAYTHIHRETLWGDYLPEYREKIADYGNSLEEVANNINSDSELLTYPWFEPQHSYLEFQGRIIVNRIFRTENFSEDIKIIEKETGLILRPIQNINRSPIPEKQYSELISQSAVENLKKIYEKDFVLFGYY
jgi:hypothetical protein